MLICDQYEGPERTDEFCSAVLGVPVVDRTAYPADTPPEDLPEPSEEYDVNSNPSRGLGDSAKKFIQKMGVKKQCGGCKKRQAMLNRLVPYKKKDTEGDSV
jgi:hypothetical protein